MIRASHSILAGYDLVGSPVRFDALHEHTEKGWGLILRNKADKKAEKAVVLA